MSVPPNKEPEWNSDDAIALRIFLESVSGQRFLLHLAESCPDLLGAGDTNSILIRSGEVKGCSSIIKSIISLTLEAPQTSAPVYNNHPDLDDDDAFDEKTNLPK